MWLKVEQNKEVTLRLTGALHQFKLGELDDRICALITNLQFTILWNTEFNYFVGCVWLSFTNQFVVKVGLDNSSVPTIAKLKFATIGAFVKLCAHSSNATPISVSKPLTLWSTLFPYTTPSTQIPWSILYINSPVRDCFGGGVLQVVHMIV